jgi:glycine cleavage system regulatory protein
MNISLILTVIGPDRPGIIESVASIVAAHGGNWMESRMCRLGGKFAGIVHLQVSQDEHPLLVEKLDDLQVQGLAISIFADVVSYSSAQGLRALVEIVANDRPGIVNQITHALAEYGVNVEELKTEVVSAPMSGGLIFQAKAKVLLPEECPLADLQRRMENLASDLQVDVKTL